MQRLQADWALDRREREQQRAKQAHFRAMLDEQVRRQAPNLLPRCCTCLVQCHL
jgi:hypothetical protein